MVERLAERSLTVDVALIERYANLTGDFNPIHLDAAFAERTPLGGIIAHGTMSLNLIWEALSATFADRLEAGAEVDIRFLHPVRPGDHVTAGGCRSPDGRSYEVWVRNQRGVDVIKGTATIFS
jgi:acyl dehydratase